MSSEAAFLSEITTLVACFALATFSYAVMSTMALALPADLFESRAVGSVAGISGAAAGAGTLVSTFLSSSATNLAATAGSSIAAWSSWRSIARTTSCMSFIA